MMKKYVIISPVRNEEEYLDGTMKSVVEQTVPPCEYIIVNDGSTDDTPNIINKYMSHNKWIRVIERPKGEHRPGGGVVAAFYEGFNLIENKDWDFVVKLDGDLSFEPDYFEKLLDKFEKNNKLGIASGWTYQPKGGKMVVDKMPGDHTRGPSKVYRRECWDDIGGLPQVLGWDTLDELKAQVLGWETQSFKDLPVMHYKPIGYKQKRIAKREIRAGERQHYLGYNFFFAISRGGYRMFQKPYIIAGFLNIIGFLIAEIRRTEQIKDKDIIKHLRRKQRQRLSFKRKMFG